LPLWLAKGSSKDSFSLFALCSFIVFISVRLSFEAITCLIIGQNGT
jgi:hypothetical protein